MVTRLFTSMIRSWNPTRRSNPGVRGAQGVATKLYGGADLLLCRAIQPWTPAPDRPVSPKTPPGG